MSLKERFYSVLVVSASEKLNTVLSSLLPESKYSPVRMVSSVNAAKRIFNERAFDYVIILSPLPDDPGTTFAIDACSCGGTVVLCMARAELHDEIYDKVAGFGVFTLPIPTSRQTLATALSWMSSARERLRRTEKETLSIEKKMEEIRTVNRAKWLLISEIKMSESDAHRYIEKQAMDRCISKCEVAKEIIKTYS